jgi:hypothetical protein
MNTSKNTKDAKYTALANAAKALKALTGTKNSMFIPKIKAL